MAGMGGNRTLPFKAPSVGIPPKQVIECTPAVPPNVARMFLSPLK
jgi:hypothetical protein